MTKENPPNDSGDKEYNRMLLELRRDQAGRFSALLATLTSGALGGAFFYGKDADWAGSEMGFFIWSIACFAFAVSLWIQLDSYLETLRQINVALKGKDPVNKKITDSRGHAVLLLFLGVLFLFFFSVLDFQAMNDDNKKCVEVPDSIIKTGCEVPTRTEYKGESQDSGKGNSDE